MKISKFTFKKYIFTGKYKSFESEYADIKLHKQEVGYIRQIGLGDVYKIVFRVKLNGGFECKTLKKTFKSYQDAKDFIITYNDGLQKEFDLYMPDLEKNP